MVTGGEPPSLKCVRRLIMMDVPELKGASDLFASVGLVSLDTSGVVLVFIV